MATTDTTPLDPAIQNPLYGIQVGSTFTESGDIGATVLETGLTTFIGQQHYESSMSGTSQYVYSDQTNQGSLSCAGSYGVSGVSKISGAVTGYVGNTTASSSKELSLNMNLAKWAGVEHIDFNEINVLDLLAGLKSNPKSAAQNALAAFVAAEAAKKKKKSNPDDVDKLTAEWVKASQDFYDNFGVGIVVGILWGGWGTVQLVFTAGTTEIDWEGGGTANFSYAGEGAAVDVAATYGHTQKSIGNDATAKVNAFANGACVVDDTTKWRDAWITMAAGGLSALSQEKTSTAAPLSGPIATPPKPEFSKPEPEKKLTDLFTQIDSLDGLEAYAQAAAFEKYKNDGGTDELSKFLASAGTKNDVSNMPTGAVSPVTGSDDESDSGASGSRAPVFARFAKEDNLVSEKAKAQGEATRPPAPDMSAYVPLGVWTIPWGRLFPWLVTAHDNRIPATGDFLDLIRLKTLQQDFLSLASLYGRIATAGPNLTIKDATVDFAGISNAFSHGAADIADFLASFQGKKPTGIKDKIASFIDQLSKDASIIYDTWAKIECLRTCELGAGITFRNALNETYARGVTISSIGDENRHLFTAATPFDPTKTKPNFDAFSDKVKAWPFVLPDGRVAMFICDGNLNHSGFLAAWPTDPVGASPRLTAKADDYTHNDYQGHACPDDGNLLTFQKNGESALRSFCYCGEEPNVQQCTVDIYPIPFWAARGLVWKGSSLTFGMGSLPDALSTLQTALSGLNQWSFDSDFWEGKDLKTFVYSMAQMRPFYFGVVKEPEHVWV